LYLIIGTFPAPVRGSPAITRPYTAKSGAVPVGKSPFVRASTKATAFESLPRESQARVPAAA
jgi:hypothetical protein